MLRSSDSTASPLAPPPSHSAGKLPAAAGRGVSRKRDGSQPPVVALTSGPCRAHGPSRGI